jgi:tol-pal system protein YbgF
MKLWILTTVAAALPFSLFAQKKEIQELQRDIALLHDTVRSNQTAQSEKMAQMALLLQQAIEAANKASTAVAVLQSTINDRFSEQNKTVGGNVAGVGTRVEQLSDEFRGVREAIADLSTRMGKLDAKLTDVSNAVRTLSAPSAAPPSVSGTTTPVGAAAATPSGPAPSAAATYENAYRDYSGGKNDLALQQFQEYLKWFRQTDLAPNAQFYIGDIYLRQGDYENAIKAFDAVLEQFSQNSKTPDAHFLKAKALFQSGQKTAAGKEYCEVVRRYPSSDLATKSKSALKGMGLSTGCGVPAAAPAKRAKRR